MSRKSRPPKAGKGAKGADEGAHSSSGLVVEESYGPPFGIVVLIALVLSIPSLAQFVEGTLPFDAAALRGIAALAVSWILVHLVHGVASSFETQQSTRRTDADDDQGR